MDNTEEPSRWPREIHEGTDVDAHGSRSMRSATGRLRSSSKSSGGSSPSTARSSIYKSGLHIFPDPKRLA